MGRIVIHVVNQYQSNIVQMALFEKGYKWSTGEKRILPDPNTSYGAEACIRLNPGKQLAYAYTGYYKSVGDTVITTKEFLSCVDMYLTE